MTEPIRTLILEDNPADAEMMQFELEEAGLALTVSVVETEEDYIQALQNFCPALILSDYDLPAYDGGLALAEAKRLCPDAPFILVTGAVTEDRAIDILTSGAKDYVLKNRLLQRLVPAVKRALSEAEEHRQRKKAEEELREAHRALKEKDKVRTAERKAEVEARKKLVQTLREREARESERNAELRRRAQEHMKVIEAAPCSRELGTDTQKLLQELQIYQIELELQNEELRHAQSELEASQARYFDLYDLAPVGYFTLSEKGLILEANLTAASILGLARGALIKQPISRFVLNEDQDIYYLHHKQLFETSEPKICDLRMVKEGSVTFWGHLEAIIVQDRNGEKVCRVAMSNITERKRVETELAQSCDLLTNLAHQVPGVIYQYRLYPNGRSAFPYSSPGMNDIYEVTPEDVREDATPVFGRLHPDDYDHVFDSIHESARTLQTFYCEFRVILPRQGLRWRWSQAHPERLADGSTLWHGIISDITERKKIEEQLQQTLESLRKALGAFIQVMVTRAGNMDG